MMTTAVQLKTLIVDDEPLGRRGMERLAQENPSISLIGSAANADEARAIMARVQVDLLLLDINMPGLTGIDLARSLEPSTLVIFQTAYSEYAIDSYELNAVDYLLKPIDPERFNRAIARALDYHSLLQMHEVPEEQPVEKSEGKISLRVDRRDVTIDLSDIITIEALRDYVIFQMQGGKRYVTHMTMKTVEALLPSPSFLRANRSVIVRKSAVEDVIGGVVTVAGRDIPLGPRYRMAFIAALN